MSSRALFLLGVPTVLLLYTLYLAGRAWPRRKWFARIPVIAVWLAAIGAQIAYRQGVIDLSSGAGRAFAWTGGVALGLFGTFLILALPIELASLFAWGAQKLASPKSFEKGAARRAFLRRALPSGLAGISAGIAGLGLSQAVAGPKVREVVVPITGLDPSLEGLTIAQVSDLHIGPTIGREYVEDVVTTVQSLNPSLIAVTGDLADGFPAQLRDRIEPLAGLKAPLGVYYVTGNHEYYWDPDAWIRAARELGLTPLMNENRVVPFGNSKVLIGGVTDTSGRQYDTRHFSDPQRAAKTLEHTALKILLAHRPDTRLVEGASQFDLQLSGHTHAGQFFPWSLLMPLAHKFYKGLYRHGDGWVYVNAGTGYWGTPHRFTIPSEITLVRITRKV